MCVPLHLSFEGREAQYRVTNVAPRAGYPLENVLWPRRGFKKRQISPAFTLPETISQPRARADFLSVWSLDSTMQKLTLHRSCLLLLCDMLVLEPRRPLAPGRCRWGGSWGSRQCQTLSPVKSGPRQTKASVAGELVGITVAQQARPSYGAEEMPEPLCPLLSSPLCLSFPSPNWLAFDLTTENPGPLWTCIHSKDKNTDKSN